MTEKKRTPVRSRKKNLGGVKLSLVALSMGLTVGGWAVLARGDSLAVNVADAEPITSIQSPPPPTPTPWRSTRDTRRSTTPVNPPAVVPTQPQPTPVPPTTAPSAVPPTSAPQAQPTAVPPTTAPRTPAQPAPQVQPAQPAPQVQPAQPAPRVNPPSTAPRATGRTRSSR